MGYVGRDAESMVRDLVDAAINMVRTEREDEVYPQAEQRADERLLDLLLPPPPPVAGGAGGEGGQDGAALGVRGRLERPGQGGEARPRAEEERRQRSREKLRQMLADGQLDDREVEIEVTPQSFPMMELMQPPQGMEGTDINFTEMLQEMLPKRKKRRTVKVPEARRMLVDEELKKLVDMDDVVNEALDRVENHGIIFIDEIDKIAGERGQAGGPDVSREGVQRDLLPIVEGSTVQTRYGYVRSDHILFIAAGAFHVSKPSRPHPRAAGPLPHPGRAPAAHRAGLRPDHDRAGERAHQAVPGAGRGGGRGARVHRRTGSPRWRGWRSWPTTGWRTSAPAGCTRSWRR